MPIYIFTGSLFFLLLYCKFGNFRENFIFENNVKRRKNSRLVHDKTFISKRQSDFSISRGFHFRETSRSFAKINPRENFRIYSSTCFCYSSTCIVTNACCQLIFESLDWQRVMCIKGQIWPPLEPKTESCFSPVYCNWFIRTITQVLKSGIYFNFYRSYSNKMAVKIGLK